MGNVDTHRCQHSPWPGLRAEMGMGDGRVPGQGTGNVILQATGEPRKCSGKQNFRNIREKILEVGRPV